MSDPVKPKAKSEETRTRILQAAQEMFHDRGFESTTMREIAAAAGVATGAAYYYFDSKDAIVLAFYDQARKDMEPLLEKALSETRDLRERLQKLIQIKLDYFAPSRKLLGALSGHTNPGHPLSPFSEQTREIRENDVHFFKRALEGSRTPGPADLKEHLPRLLWMYQMGIILFWINDASKGQTRTSALLDQSLDLVTPADTIRGAAADQASPQESDAVDGHIDDLMEGGGRRMAAIAIVGGTGFLGRHVTAALEEDGYSVRALSRRTGFNALRPDPDAFRGVEAVVNLAGIKREEGDQTFQAVHVDLVRRLVEVMQTAGLRRLVHISVVVARASPNLPYHDTKWKGEEIIRASGLDWTILRPGVIYGEGDDMLSHLALMIRTASVFPIVGDGSSPMRPVDARDVAEAVVAALRKPCVGKTYEIVGPDRLELRDVVRRVADAMDLPLSIWPTPVALMRLPLRIMEAVMQQPLSTRAQLALLVEGLDGDPAPARSDLGLATAPFTVARLRPLLEKTRRDPPFNLRLFSARRPPQEIPAPAFWMLLAFAVPALTFVFQGVPDVWMGMVAVMGLALTGAVLLGPVRRRLKPSLFRVITGLGAGIGLYGITILIVAVLPGVWPGWKAAARALYAWRGGHSPLFLGLTLVMIVLAEELLWRGVVARFLMERWGRVAGIVAAATLYAVAHLATFNPLLLAAAFGCGLFWGWLYAATDNLVAPTVSHLLWDVLLLFAFPVIR